LLIEKKKTNFSYK